ncbi:MAG: branched-chain amino acid transporter permease [Frankiales bacterium]|nr:branched-chain amino acid transporter permease [Frankiales bacterium]
MTLLTFSWIDTILVYIMFAVSLNLLIGYTGVFAVAPAAFGAIGGYSAAYLFVNHGTDLVIGMLVGIVISAMVAFLMGVPAFRLPTVWVILLTLGIQQVITGIFASINQFGAGYGLQVGKITFFGATINTSTTLFPVLLIFAVIITLLCWRLGESPYGRVLRGIRDNEQAVRALGRPVFRYKVAVLVSTSVMASVAGSMMTVLNGVAQPTLFSFSASVAMISMVIIGGRGSLAGTLLAAILITLLTPFLEHVVSLRSSIASLWQEIIYGALLVVIIYLRPRGIIPEGLIPRRRIPLGAYAAAESVTARLESAAARPRTTAIPRPERVDLDVVPEREVVLRADNLYKSFGGVHAVNGLSFELQKGAITALVGPNGAGKTTVFNLLTGAIPVDSGTVWLDGEDVTGLKPDVLARRGLVRSFQDVKLFGDLSVYENVMLGVQHHPGENGVGLFFRPGQSRSFERQARERALEWLSFVGMASEANRTAGALGYGQQKLVAVARVLASEARVLLLDEPASGIDHSWVDVTLDLISEIRSTGRTICVVEHNLHVVGQLADHVYFMELGRVTAEGGLAELTSDPRLAEAYFGID